MTTAQTRRDVAYRTVIPANIQTKCQSNSSCSTCPTNRKLSSRAFSVSFLQILGSVFLSWIRSESQKKHFKMNSILRGAGNGLLRSPIVAPGAVVAKFNPLNKGLHVGLGLRADTTPAYVSCEKGKTVMWCACGHSQKQPLCDGSHKTKGQGKTPVAFTAPEAKEYLMCTCKKTSKQPICDGSQACCSNFV